MSLQFLFVGSRLAFFSLQNFTSVRKRNCYSRKGLDKNYQIIFVVINTASDRTKSA